MRYRIVALLVVLAGFHAPETSGQVARIIGGGQAPADAYPWMAALVEKGRSPANGQLCGGMLVAPQWVLTAAHCVEGENRNTLDIWVGLHDLRATAGAQKRNILTILRHPGYRSDRYGNLFYDAALILLDRPVTGIPSVSLASLPSHNDLGEMVRVLGWGSVDPIFDVFPNILRQADLSIVDIAAAQADYQNVLGPSHLAAAVPDGSRDACAGDSGGPLFRIIDSDPILVGIVSFGEGCATPGIEGIYTNVLAIRDWIDGALALTEQPPALGLRYRGRVIQSGDRWPGRRDGTHFGRTRAGGRGKIRTFRLHNGGTGLMTVHGVRVANPRFRLRSAEPSLIYPGGLPKLRILFTPRRRGTVSSLVRINSNDPAHPLFWFRIKGKGR